MNGRSHTVVAILFFAALFLVPVPHALAQDSQDDQPHIQPRNSPYAHPNPNTNSEAGSEPAASTEERPV